MLWTMQKTYWKRSTIKFSSSRVEDILHTLKALEAQIGNLRQLGNSGSSKHETPKRHPTTSIVDESDVYGRKNEIEQLVNRLLSVDIDGEKPSVITIVGLGGLGKTTLAKVVYNDPRVQNHFDLTAWVCVSEQYDALKVTKTLLEEIGSSGSIADDNLNQMQIKLRKQIKGKKFLFVLDDIWHDNYIDWVDLKSTFVQGEIGSKVIVTTRKDSVALMMDTEPMYLKTLSSEESWSLFERHAFKNKELREHPELQEVGKRITDKCKGLPLALKAVAGLLRLKSGIEEWRIVLRSGIWEQSLISSAGILPALQLSYNDLTQNLKRCFAYCAIFPKDFAFDREYVVQLWIANGLVQQLQTDKTIEDTGNRYFLELLSRSLIEQESKKFMMHDLVNDLAQFVSSNLCLWLEDLQGSHLLERARHLSYSMKYHEKFEKFKLLYNLEQLRTLLPVNQFMFNWCHLDKEVLHNIFPKLVSLRVLSLSNYYITELPDILFIKLNQLRFLDLSYTHLIELPASTCVLYNLQTLLLSHCQYLVALPSKMENLISLCYLDIRASPLLKMRLEESKLKFINVLLGAKCVIGGCDGMGIEELGDFHNLHGSLSILELQNVGNGKEAAKAKLSNKEHLEELSFEWSQMEPDDSQVERDILDNLSPSTKIKELKIGGYRGTKFPNWLGDQSFCTLVNLSLENCNNCDSLPALGQLPSLKFLIIQGMHGISKVTEEFYGSESSKEPFQSLVELKFNCMPEWKEWHVLGKGEFPKLEYLFINDCPKLIGKLPEKLCSLKMLNIWKCQELILEDHCQLNQCDNLHDFAVTHLKVSNRLKPRRLLIPTGLKDFRV
ncbi:putative disease resistance RPP13-like protein 1 [Lycium ferocissimum]|uniref:putative disease resistance RPP13-like protein 1 n=1 Tax=Lycium ferocissimum TaxID=112874 RepID=UPI0028165AA5|nr:putative disease resistance RPP13-like protein 1 [Lycium ferocissimum]